MNTLLLKKSLRIVETLIVGAMLWACTSSNDDGGFVKDNGIEKPKNVFDRLKSG